MRTSELCRSIFLMAVLHMLFVSPARCQDASGVPEGYALVEGDILVRLDALGKAGGMEPNLWPNGIVYFEFAAGLSAADRDTVLSAMGVLESRATLQFQRRTFETNYILFRSNISNSSVVGMVGGMQPLNLMSPFSKTSAIHEIMHALGFRHEQSRPDRDTYVTIHFENVSQTACGSPGDEDRSCNHNFEISETVVARGPYDFGSIMHYNALAFSSNGANTIEVNPPWDVQWQNRIGLTSDPSALDGINLGYLYPESSWRFFESRFFSAAGAAGSIRSPYSTLDQVSDLMPNGGVLYVLEDQIDVAGVINTPMIIRAAYGTVVFGDGQ